MADPERRQPPGLLRVRKYIPVTVEEQATRTIVVASVADVSATGARLITSEFLSNGTRLTVRMNENPYLIVQAHVRWAQLDQNPRPGANPQFQVGTQFLDLNPEDTHQIQTYLESERRRSEKT